MNWERRGLIFAPPASGLAGHFTHAQLPTVDVLDERTLRIYFSSRDLENRSGVFSVDIDRRDIGKILSVSEKPLLELGRPGTFDDRGIMPSWVVTQGSRKYLYYIGWNVGDGARHRLAIGLALSDDGGRTYRKYSDGPIMDRDPGDPYGVSNQCVLVENGLWKTWYMSYTDWELVNGVMEPFYVVKYAESVDGIKWRRSGDVCISLQEGEGGISRPSVLAVPGGYRMWFAVRDVGDYRDNPKHAYRIERARSSDGVNWEREGRIRFDGPGQWDSVMQAYPFVIDLGGVLHMFYNGNGFGASGFGYAVYPGGPSE